MTDKNSHLRRLRQASFEVIVLLVLILGLSTILSLAVCHTDLAARLIPGSCDSLDDSFSRNRLQMIAAVALLPVTFYLARRKR